MESQKGASAAAIITLVLGLAVGGGVGYAAAANMNNDDHHMEQSASVSESNPNVGTKAADLRANLVALGTEHMDLTYTAVAAALQNAKNADADKAQLVQNGHDIGALVGSVYGKDAEKTFDSVWDIHLTQFVNYAVASNQNDEAAKAAALKTIDEQYSHPLAAYLAKANPNLPEDTLYNALKQHVDMTAVMIDAEARGDYAAATDQRDMAVEHIEGLMTTLAGGIVKQFPKKF